MIKNKKISESDLLGAFREGRKVILAPLQLVGMEEESYRKIGKVERRVDAIFEGRLPNEKTGFRFVVEAKSGYTPRMIQDAVTQIKSYARTGENPMILVPYLSEERLLELEQASVSGIDLCGNGVVTVPGRLFIRRSGEPNRYPDTRPLKNPFQGKSAMVARVFFTEQVFPSLGAVRDAVKKGGVNISLSQVSKTVQALKEALVVSGQKRSLHLMDPDRLLDQLGMFWRPEFKKECYVKLPGGLKGLSRLNNAKDVDWALTGTESVVRYVAFGQSGPANVVVSDMAKAINALGAKVETVPGYADVRLLESDEPGFFFDVSRAEDGMRWASQLQTWIELRNGDARQQTAAREIRGQLIAGDHEWNL